MSKEEFLNSLRKRLNVLEDSEIEDIISEYEGYIEEKVNTGMTEKEAVKELGNIDEIVSDLLAAYKVKEQPNENSFNSILSKISNGIDNFMDSLDNKSGKDIIRLLIEIIIILLITLLLKIPFEIIKDLGGDIFLELASPVGNIFRGIWFFIVEFSYVIVAIVFFIKTIEKRYFKSVSERIVDEVEDAHYEEKEKREHVASKKEKKVKKEVIDETRRESKVKVVERKEHGVIDVLVDVCVLMLKIIALFIVMGVVCYLIGISVAIGVMIYLIVKGVTYYGILTLMVALFLGGALVLKLIIYFIINKKIKTIPVFSELIVFIIILGLGLTFSTIEIGNTEIIYDNSNVKTAKVEKVIPIKRDYMSLYYYDNIQIDNSLNNEVRIEYVYPDLNEMKIEIDLEECGAGYCLHSDINYYRWNKKTLDYLIENLKNKKVYTYDYRITKNIYVSEKDLNRITGNKDYYDDYQTYNFTKTYNVLDVFESDDEAYAYLTLKQFQFSDVKTVKVLKPLAANIIKGNNYEFTFTYRGEKPDDNIEDIFEECNLINIKETNNQGLDQNQGL